MRITKSTLVILISMLVFSILVANVANLLSSELIYKNNEDNSNIDVSMTDTPNNLIWFLQISDIHISIFRDPSRITEFKEFCDYTLSVINPSVVLASGDLTDAKTRDNIGSKQFETEWVYYKSILNECKIQEKTVWLDIRGNHDNFNVINIKSKENYFTNYSIQGKVHPKSYIYQITKNKEVYSFIGVDACLDPGPRRPFNFVGMLDKTELEMLNKLIEQAKLTSNYTIWFGHFPTSCIITEGESVRDLIGKLDQGMIYLCGHLHRLGGIVPKMYALQKEGFLELELGDWKDNRLYRLLALDHGMFSFIDVSHREWPVALITNPKHALFMIPGKETTKTMKRSTHIRVLAFSLSRIQEVRIRIDNENWKDCQHAGGPLYVAPWNPDNYEIGMHNIYVYVKDEHGREKFDHQPFSLDGTRLSFNILPKIALMSNASTVFKVMFYISLVFSIMPLCAFRIMHKLVKEGKINRPQLRKGCFKICCRKLWILTTIDRIFWPLLLYPIYLSFGPWSIGHIIENHIGVIFAWGIYVNNTFLPGSFTYVYGFLQILMFQVPIMFILANGVDHRFQYHITKSGKSTTFVGKLGLHLPFLILFTVQIILAYFFWLAYGTLAFVIGPLRTWSVILAIFLWYQALVLPEKCTREAIRVWNIKVTTIKSDRDLNLVEK